MSNVFGINWYSEKHSLYIVLFTRDQANRILVLDWCKSFCSASPWFTRLSDHWHTYVYVMMIDLSSSVQWNLCVDLLRLLYACVNKRRFTYREGNRRSVIINVRCIARLERFTFHRESKGKSSSLPYHALQWIFLISCASDNSEYFFKSRERETDFSSPLVLYIQVF